MISEASTTSLFRIILHIHISALQHLERVDSDLREKLVDDAGNKQFDFHFLLFLQKNRAKLRIFFHLTAIYFQKVGFSQQNLNKRAFLPVVRIRFCNHFRMVESDRPDLHGKRCQGHDNAMISVCIELQRSRRSKEWQV